MLGRSSSMDLIKASTMSAAGKSCSAELKPRLEGHLCWCQLQDKSQALLPTLILGLIDSGIRWDRGEESHEEFVNRNCYGCRLWLRLHQKSNMRCNGWCALEQALQGRGFTHPAELPFK